MFRCNETNGNGFFIRFANGYRISVQFGANTYCENYNKEGKFLESKDAEVAVVSPNGSFVKIEGQGDTIIPNVTPNELLDIMNKVAQLTDFYPNI